MLHEHSQLVHTPSRRDILRQASCGIGYLALAAMTTQAAARDGVNGNSLAPRSPHFAPRAKRVIMLYMSGGPSQLDTFDFKPELQKRDGQPVPAKLAGSAKKARPGDLLLASPWKFSRCGESGLWISELFPHLAKSADDLCILNSMYCDSPAHLQAAQQLHTGATTLVRPSLGAWLLYGLGTENESLPGFVTVGQLGRGGGAQNRGSAFLPASFQGMPIDASGNIAHLQNVFVSRDVQAEQIQAIQALDQGLQQRTGADPQLDGLIKSYELSFRMQAVAPEVLDIRRESAVTHAQYGIGKSTTDSMGRSCLIARRLAEAGVRFIEVGGGGTWDQHARMRVETAEAAAQTDQPVAALIADLKQRGMLNETLIVWGGEFGRLPANGSRDGRDHNNQGYTMWLAGGGVKGGLRHGATDEFGFTAIKDKVHLHDLHATILHLLGLDHEKLTYRYSGREFRLTDVHGRVVKAVIA